MTRYQTLPIALASLAAVLALVPQRAARADDIVYAMDDLGNVRQYNASGGLVATFSGVSNSGLTEANYFVASGNDLFVTQDTGNTWGVGEYQLNAGTHPTVSAVNTNLIPAPQMNYPYFGIALADGNLLVANEFGSSVGEYGLTGNTINASFISGLSGARNLTVAGGDVFVWGIGASDTVAEYTIGGTAVNTSLITGVQAAGGLAVLGNDLFLLGLTGTVSEYTTSGMLVNASLITGLSDGAQLVVSDGDLLIANGRAIVEYDTSGNLLNPSFGTSPSIHFDSLYVVATPEPATWILLAIGAASLAAFRRCQRPSPGAGCRGSRSA